jgi:ABC-type transport system involved in Fe-S cluster assembly fused permease/ATPase subunit
MAAAFAHVAALACIEFVRSGLLERAHTSSQKQSSNPALTHDHGWVACAGERDSPLHLVAVLRKDPRDRPSMILRLGLDRFIFGRNAPILRSSAHLRRKSTSKMEQSKASFWQPLRQALQLFWRAADTYARRRLILALALVSLGALLTAATPVVLKLVVDALGNVDSTTSLNPLLLVVLFVGGQYLWRCVTEVRNLVHAYAEQRIHRRVRRQLFEHLIRLPLQFHLERRIGTVGETVEQGLKGYQLLLVHVVYTILPIVVELGLVAAVLLHFGHPIYLVIIAVASAGYAIVFHRGARAGRSTAEVASAAHITAHGVLTDSLLNQETVKYFDAEQFVCRRYDDALSGVENAWRTFFSSRVANGLMIAVIFALSLGVSLVHAANEVMRGTMTIGDFVLVNAYIARLVQPLEMLGYAVRDVAQSLAFLDSMLALFRQTQEEPDRATPQGSITRGELAFRNVSFGYRPDRPILNDVSFVVPAGKTVAVVGVSGSGKSSLIRLLFRLYPANSGSILLDGRPTSQMPLSEVRRAIAVVPQDTVLFHDTIGHNIGFGRLGATQDEIEAAARLANLHDLIVGLPDGYETVVGERGLKLSGGERQRVAIARAALKRPLLFVFDEATSSLDTRTEREILRNLMDLSSRSTTLVIAHRLSTVVHADEIIVLEQGVIVERGAHRQLLARGGHYAALWEAQHSVIVRERAADAILSSPRP